MFCSNIACVWIVLTLILITLFPTFECYDDHHFSDQIQYDREFIYHLANAPISRHSPPNLPEWVPLRSDPTPSGHPITRRRGKKRGGVRQRVRRRGHRPPLPTITLANVRSIKNKLDELRVNIRYDHEYRNSSIICLTETWLKPDISNNILELPGFELIRQDRSFEETNKTKGGGLCIYMNKLWCNNFTVRSSFCSEDIELICISFQPFYLPREFPQVHVLLVYIPPSAKTDNAINIIQQNVQQMEDQSPNSPKVILGDFNQCRLEESLPHFCQCIGNATRGNNILDRCYTSIPDAYTIQSNYTTRTGAIRSPCGSFTTKIQTEIKTEKPIKKTVRVWDNDSILRCFKRLLRLLIGRC